MIDSNKTKESVEKSNLIFCNICLENSLDALSLCPNNDGYCIGCINSYFENQFFKNAKITTNCPVCKVDFYNNKLEAVLNKDVLFLLFKSNIFENLELASHNELITCPLCPEKKEFSFIINKEDFIQYVKCLGDSCGKTCCLYCMKEAVIKNHYNCKENYRICEILIKAMSLAKISLCSSCKSESKEEIEYLKGNGCTHMNCKKCNNHICYVCGKSEGELDYCHEEKVIIFGHNKDWKTNIKRCPMYLSEFNEIDKNWPRDDSSATINLYEYKLKSFIVKIIEKFGKDKVKSAYDAYKNSKLQGLSENYIDDYQNFKKLVYIEDRITNELKKMKIDTF